MAELVENLLGIHFHQVDVLHEEPEVLVKSRGVNRIDDRNEGAPVLVIQLDRFFFEFSFS